MTFGKIKIEKNFTVALKECYVYVHKRKTNGEIFYVGKGVQERWRKLDRNYRWKNIANKYGVVGDSTIEGTGSLGATGVYTKLAAQALGIPMLEISCGGKQQLDMETNLAGWSGYLALGRVLIDAMGRNGANANLSYFSYYKTFRSFGGDKIMKIGVFPATSGTFIQTILRAYPSNVPDVQMAEWLKYGIIDYVFDAQSIRGSNPAKWLANTTTDGTHQSDTGNNLLKTEYQAKLETITVT